MSGDRPDFNGKSSHSPLEEVAMFKCIFPVLFSLFLVFGCGGGDNKSAGPPELPSMQPTMPPVTTPEPQEPPAPTPETPTAALNRLLGNSNIAIKGNTINADIWSTRINTQTSTLSLSDMTRRGGIQPLAERQGVSLASTHSRGITGNAFDYGGWMEYSFFLVAVWNPINNDPFNPSEQVFADVFSVGNAPGNNPVSGSATWSGAVVGVDASEADSKGNVIIGDATIRIGNFASPAVDVLFTGLVDQATNISRSDMSWRGLPVRNGAFDHNGDLSVGVAFGDRGNAFNSLTGRFYGSNHEEVGGIFIRDQIVGAFGGKR